jgi:fumarate reductase subunit C
MTTDLPQKPAPWWARFAAAIRYVARMQPTVVLAVFRALLVVLGTFGLDNLDVVDTRGTAIILALYGLVEVITSAVNWHKVTPNPAVVERIDSGQVVAGQGSELPTGMVIRTAGSLGDSTIYPQ